MALRKFGILSGLVAPVLWAASIAICGMLRPGFSHVTQYISELGERGSPTELTMRYAAFIPTGLMHVCFAAFLAVAFRGSRLGVFAAALLGVNGLARIGAGVFACDAGCGGLATSFSQRMHSLSASVGFSALIVSAALWGIAFRRYPGLRDLTAYSVGSAIVGLSFLLLMVWNADLGTARGLFERLSSGALSLWIFVFAARLRDSDPSRA
jgi:hypothetical membrane protein